MVSIMGKTYTSTNHRECGPRIMGFHLLLPIGDKPRTSLEWFALLMGMRCLSCHDWCRCIYCCLTCCNGTFWTWFSESNRRIYMDRQWPNWAHGRAFCTEERRSRVK